MYTEFYIKLSYLVGSLAFVWGLRLLSSPDSARKGNIIAGFGMGIAIVAAMLDPDYLVGSNNYGWIVSGVIVGGVIGATWARRVQMTAMPQMVSILNGFGGACAVVLGVAEFIHMYQGDRFYGSTEILILLFAILVGGIAFTGSFLAFGKLEGWVRDNFLVVPKVHHIFNLSLLAAILILSGIVYFQGADSLFWLMVAMTVLSLYYGISFVAPIGGADMPVVISLLNSFSGISAAAAGLIYNNQFMLVGGILVGASGTILTLLMCQAMNRSLLNVLVGGFGGSAAGAAAAKGDQVIREVSLNDAAIMMYYSKSVMVVPGYGLAVAQAQKVCKEVDDLLSKNGVDVNYAIHPVAGRMPGHMNVLLAEADVPYPKLLDLDDANGALPNTDVVLIVGANDVVNPAAETDPGSPIYGMPVLQVWKAKQVIVMKRSMRSGYAGIENPLFFYPNNRMLFGDAKDTLSKLTSELKQMS
ncbi:MAG: NAD(P)(+) transhydrogenase (Re/Si-specific) subunit beta [Haliscomenobacter sp.]|nr:NAD(P)(+) transhydrogenase (Re/Si-specific) subunit beta [Haliscomenobacter sp.]